MPPSSELMFAVPRNQSKRGENSRNFRIGHDTPENRKPWRFLNLRSFRRYTDPAMIEELWTKLRGIDRWPRTEAEVTAVSRFEGNRNRKIAIIRFRYKDGEGCSHGGQVRVNDYSSLYHISTGDKTNVRYMPKHPDRYWSEERGVSVETPLVLVWAVAFIAMLSYVLSAFRK
jgi:hypothetical protein